MEAPPPQAAPVAVFVVSDIFRLFSASYSANYSSILQQVPSHASGDLAGADFRRSIVRLALNFLRFNFHCFPSHTFGTDQEELGKLYPDLFGLQVGEAGGSQAVADLV